MFYNVAYGVQVVITGFEHPRWSPSDRQAPAKAACFASLFTIFHSLSLSLAALIYFLMTYIFSLVDTFDGCA